MKSINTKWVGLLCAVVLLAAPSASAKSRKATVASQAKQEQRQMAAPAKRRPSPVLAGFTWPPPPAMSTGKQAPEEATRMAGDVDYVR